MPGRVGIRRLQIRGLAPRDHPSPGDLERRLADAARKYLPEALTEAVGSWSGAEVVRMRRLEVDITLDAAFEPEAFAGVLARAIAHGMRRAQESGVAGGDGDGIVCYATRAIYLGALLEALAEGRAPDCWWLRDADGLRFLSPGAAIRTAVLADPAVGLEALAGLRPLRFAVVLRALEAAEADRVLDGLADLGPATASFEDCVAAIAAAAGELPAESSALALYLRASLLRPGVTGRALATIARGWAAAVRAWSDAPQGDTGAAPAGSHATSTWPDGARTPDWQSGAITALLAGIGGGGVAGVPARILETVADRVAANVANLPDSARRALGAAIERHRDRAASATTWPSYVFTQFGGLLLLVPNLGMADIAATVADWPDVPPDTAALVSYATLGICAGRKRFRQWLGDPLWREFFGLDLHAPVAAITARLGAIADADWATLAPLGVPLDRQRDARFLLAPRALAGSRAASHSLAVLARAATSRFARRLPAFGAASAPFLWANVIGVNAALERRPNGWTARLGRPPLDVLLSLSRIAEDTVRFPSGARVEISRVAP